MASTTSVEDSGLLGRILPLFTKDTGIEVRVVAQGTGQALETARRGDADLVLVHDPEAEQKFISEGYGIDRRQIAWNDFVIVGPKDDPAHIKGGRDAGDAFKAIAAAKAPFVSRGDRSGTNALELRLWKTTGIDPKEGEGRAEAEQHDKVGYSIRRCHHSRTPRRLRWRRNAPDKLRQHAQAENPHILFGAEPVGANHDPGIEFAPDSPLEGDGFELLVQRCESRGFPKH